MNKIYKKTRIYANLLVHLLDGASENIQIKRVRALKEILKKRGDLSLSREIIKEFYRAWQGKKGKTGLVVTARPLTPEIKKHVQESLLRKGFLLEEKCNTDILGGIAFFLGNEFLLDASILNKLHKLDAKFKKTAFK